MNEKFFYYLNSFAGRSQIFDWLIIFCAQYLGYLMISAFFVFIFLVKKNNLEKLKMAVFAFLSVIFSRFVITEIIRFFYYIDRPFVNNHIVRLVNHDSTASFPSGHAAIFFALAMAVYLIFNKKWGWLFFVGAFLIGISRIIAGVHWPFDILSGAIVGVFSTLFLFFILQNRLK